MRYVSLRRSAVITLLLGGCVQLHAVPSYASLLAQDRSSELQGARAAIRRLLALGERAESQHGGQIALARRRTETSSAKTTNAWLDLLPDFSLAVRRQIEQQTDTDFSVPSWRLDLEGQISLSAPKLRTIDVARAAQAKEQAELKQVEHEARKRTLEACFELYFIERRTALLRDQVAKFESLASAMAQSQTDGPTGDHVLVEGYLGELRGTLADSETQQSDATQQLAATLEVALHGTGLDPRLTLPQLLESIRAEFAGSPSEVARIRRAEVELEEQRLRWADSQSWYIPELRSTTLALFPGATTGEPANSSIHLTSVTTEVALGLRLRSGVPALQAAQRHAIAKSRLAEEHSRWLRAQTEDQARARIDELARSWLEDGSIRVANEEFDDAVRRFARGERTVAELAAASRTLLAAHFQREQLLKGAILAQITISTNDSSDLGPPSATRREELRSAEVDNRWLRSLERAPSIRSARAAAQQATQRARSERSLLAMAVEAGVLLPLYESNDLDRLVRPELSLSGSGSLATVVREASLLGRWSLDLRPTYATQRAYESEARLRHAQVELERKKYQWAELEARFELAHARRAFELSTRTSQFAFESWQQELRWFQQGAASERDVRAAELAHHTARAEQSEAEARRQTAESVMASYLEAARGTHIAVDEQPEQLEVWARQHFIPENRLLGFESEERRHEAKLELDLAHAQTEALARPARGSTFTTQVVQGLRGGAFSLTLALSVALDSARDAPQLTRAAEQEGKARGRMLAFERELDEQRARLQQRFEEASALLETETTIQRRLAALADALHRNQAAAPDVHPAVKQRQSDALRAASFDSERRRLAADEQRRSAQLLSLALGESSFASRSGTNVPAALAATEDTLIQKSPDVAASAAAAEEARNHQPLPFVSALHPVGPFGIGSYSANRVVGPSTTKVWRGDLGVGLALGLDESVSFLASQRLSNAADLDERAARQRAALRTVRELGRAWTARELARLSREEEVDARQRLDGAVKPRFELGQVTAGTLLEAQQQHAFSLLRRSSDEALHRTQRALLSALGASVSDATLDEYQERAARWSRSYSLLVQPKAVGTDPAQRAAKERSAAAASETAASALRFVSPVTALIEARPAQIETTTGTEDLRESSTGHELLWVFSLIVPFKPKEFGALSVAAAHAKEGEEELGVASRDARLRRSRLETRLAGLQKEYASAIDRKVSAERAFAELDRRLRAAQDHTTIDEVARAQAALFDARRAEVVVSGALLEAALQLHIAQEIQ